MVQNGQHAFSPPLAAMVKGDKRSGRQAGDHWEITLQEEVGSCLDSVPESLQDWGRAAPSPHLCSSHAGRPGLFLPRGLCTGCSPAWTAVPVLRLSPLQAFTTPGSLLNATFQGGPHRWTELKPRPPPHSIPNPLLRAFAAPTCRVTLRVPGLSLCHFPPTSVPRLCEHTGHLAALLATLPECRHARQTNRVGEARRPRNGASDVRHPQRTLRLPHT